MSTPEDLTSGTNDVWRSGTLDLAHPALGTRVVHASDDFFAPKERLISPDEPLFMPGKYDENGKWMDGWESRRRRDAGHDHCIVRLGRPGLIRGVDIDTRSFTGNFPPAASLEACVSDTEIPSAAATWTTLLSARALGGDRRHLWAVDAPGPWTHLRLNIYPDGGVARLRIYGQVHVDWAKHDAGTLLDLASVLNGARALACSDEQFGKLANITWPDRAPTMGDGWETRRRRTPGHDWGLVALGHTGRVERLVLDTAHFKGNYPDRCSIQAIDATGVPEAALAAQSMFWPVLLPEQKLEADREHVFQAGIVPHEKVAFLRVNLIPDGGLSRLRAYGRIVR